MSFPTCEVLIYESRLKATRLFSKPQHVLSRLYAWILVIDTSRVDEILLLYTMNLLLLASIFSAICSAEVVCNDRVPHTLIPELLSCDYALRRLEFTNQQCGFRNMIFSPTAKGAFVFPLPRIFVGAGSDYTPSTKTWCAIMIMWQPRDVTRKPQVEEDVFPFSRILQAARRIRNGCLAGRPGHLPTIGREWIRPYQYVDVQFGGVFPEEFNGIKGNWNDTAEEDTNLTVFLADGSNLNVSTNASRGTWQCGLPSIYGFANGNLSTSQRH